MVKDNLIGGELWEKYSKKIFDRMNEPKFRGKLTVDDAKKISGKLVIGDTGAEACGDAVKLYWIVDKKNDIILDSKFESFGCGTAIAASDVTAELCIGKTVQEALKITNIDVEFALRDEPETPALPPQKMHCSVMSYDVLKDAAKNYLGYDIEKNDDPIVCECAQVRLSTIKDVIKLHNITEVSEITRLTKAGAFCKSCKNKGGHEERKYYLDEILEQTRLEIDKEKCQINKSEEKEISFDDLSIVKKIKAIEKILDDEIRFFLHQDGGDVEIDDLKVVDGKTFVYIKYQGACVGCSGAATGTLYAIQNILTQEFGDSIEVRIVDDFEL